MYVYVVGLDVQYECIYSMVTRGEMGDQCVRTVDHMNMNIDASMKYRKVVMRGMMRTLSLTFYIDIVSGCMSCQGCIYKCRPCQTYMHAYISTTIVLTRIILPVVEA